MTLEVQTVIMLRARIDVLHREQPQTHAGRESLAATIADLEHQITAVAGGRWPLVQQREVAP